MHNNKKISSIKAALIERRFLFWGALGFSLFVNLLMLAVPIYSMQVLDRVLSSGSIDTLLMLTIIVAISLFFMGFLQALRDMVFSQIGRWLDERLSIEIAQKTIDVAIHRPNIGSQPMRDFGVIKGFITSPALGQIFDAPWAIIYFIVIFLIHFQLGIAVVLGAVILLVLALMAEKLPKEAATMANDEQIKSMQVLDSIVRNAEVVRSMGLAKFATQRWYKFHRATLEYNFSASNFNTVISNSTRTFRMALQVALTGLGAWFVIDGQMSAGGIIAVSILSSKALAPFDTAVSIYHSWTGVKKSYKRLAEIDKQVITSQSAVLLPAPKGHLILDKITYQDHDNHRWLLRGINITIEPGKSIGIIGLSGSGKTTLARLIVGVLIPSSGYVRLDGASLGQWNQEQLGSFIGYLPQSVELFSGTLSENIARLEKNADDQSIVKAAQIACVHEAILRFPQGYQTDIGTNGAFLSAGQRQRIGLARCFFGEPKLVVLDEPNANLDSEGEQALEQCLLNAKSSGITTVTIAHRISILKKADKILVLHGGEAKLFGPTDEILGKLSNSNRNAHILQNLKLVSS